MVTLSCLIRGEKTTLLLWYGPFGLLLIGLAVLIWQLRKRKNNIVENELSEEQTQTCSQSVNHPGKTDKHVLFWIFVRRCYWPR